MAHNGWHDDVLGDGWQARTIPLGEDTEGPLDATLVRATAGPRSGPAILYIHGFVDYFFQAHLGDAMTAHGYGFYGIDLRKYGRSLHEGQSPNYVTDLADYRTELDEAARLIEQDGYDRLVVMGHSTGGLIACLWANARPDLLDAVVLNSPWFDLNEPWLTRTVGTRAIDVLGAISPRTVVGSLAEFYGRALHVDSGGEWDYNLAWKPHHGFPARAGWMRSVRRSHARIARGLNIQQPVLMCASGASGDNRSNHDHLLTTDSVLNVEHMVARASGLGGDVTIRRIPGGAHDLALSPEPARGQFFDTVLTWLDEKLPPAPAVF